VNNHFVEVWHGDILSDACLLKGIEEQRHWSLLNQAEQEKAATFTRPELQRKYIKTQGVLREILGHYMNDAADKIEIKIAEHGKPFVEGSLVYFNLSHSGNKFVVAVSNVSEIGIDLEQYKERKSLSGLAGKCFADEERQYWHSLPEQQKTQQFYQFWVRKEAFVKAVGRGIALGLNRCVINPDDQSCFLRVPEAYGVSTDWKIQAVTLDKKDICALVVKDVAFNYKQRRLR